MPWISGAFLLVLTQQVINTKVVHNYYKMSLQVNFPSLFRVYKLSKFAL